MLNYYPRDINFGSLTQTIINVETNSFQPAQKMHMGQACCVGIVWIRNECFVMFFFTTIHSCFLFFLFLEGRISFRAQSSLFSDWSWVYCESLLFTFDPFQQFLFAIQYILPDNPQKLTFRQKTKMLKVAKQVFSF